MNNVLTWPEHQQAVKIASAQPRASGCLEIWASSRAWLLFFPIFFFIVQGNIQTGTVDEQLRLAVQSDTFWGRWGFLLLICLCFAIVLRRLSSLLPEILAEKHVVAFSLLAPLSVFWSDLPSRSLFNGLGEIALTLLAVYVVCEFNPIEQMQLFVLPGLVALLLSAGAVFLAPAIGLDSEEGGAWRGIFQQKNVCGLVVLFLAMPVLFIPVSNTVSKSFRAIYLVLASTLLIMSRAKTAWCIALLCIAFVVTLRLLRKFRFKDFMFLSLLLGVGTSSIALAIYENSASLLAVLGKDPTMSQRTVIWAAVWESIMKHPFLGYGFSAFWNGINGESLNIILTTGWLLAQAQNGFLDLWLQLGLFGIIMFAALILMAFRDALVCFRLGRQEVVHWYCAILVCSVIYNFSESFLANPRHICWFLFTIACLGLHRTANGLRVANANLTRASRFAHQPVSPA